MCGISWPWHNLITAVGQETLQVQNLANGQKLRLLWVISTGKRTESINMRTLFPYSQDVDTPRATNTIQYCISVIVTPNDSWHSLFSANQFPFYLSAPCLHHPQYKPDTNQWQEKITMRLVTFCLSTYHARAPGQACQQTGGTERHLYRYNNYSSPCSHKGHP